MRSTPPPPPPPLNRRTFLRVAAALPAPLLLAACRPQSATPTPGQAASAPVAPALTDAASAPGLPDEMAKTATPAATSTATTTATPTSTSAATQAQVLAPTPSCGDDDDVTPAQTAGPFFTSNSPERRSLLEDGMPGALLTLSGQVLSTGCQPVAGALLDFWQADDVGVYDTVGFTLRGHQFTDDDGRYTLETILPGLYAIRTRHIHVNVQAPNQPILTTQLYFPGEPANDRDSIYNPELLVSVDPASDGQAVEFNFVLPIG